ncbi:MAG TPA: toxin-activating lysine-acyltransferase [Oxalicibacterium sp.]|nr:toxin-activating lysine-acyltransferase [Oxalicibacterium sp.]
MESNLVFNESSASQRRIQLSESNTETALAALEDAKESLAKLPILGPALWLYARDPIKKYMFLGDLDWAVLPPVVLDQCRLFTKGGLPYAFVTWALANDHIDARFRTKESKLAPHEWKTGEHVWIVSAVAPFGQLEETLRELRETAFSGKKVSALLPDPQSGELNVIEWPPLPIQSVH